MPEKNAITHCLALVTRKKKWEEVTGKKWMVAVVPISKWKEIQKRREICSSDAQWCKDALPIAFPKVYHKYRRMVLTGEIRETCSTVEAYKEAYSWVEELEASRLAANVHCDGIECHVYAMRMKSTAWKVGRFAARNAHIPESARMSTSCFYVGQTGLRTVEERFNRHIGDGRHKTTWGRNHFLKPFEMAYDDEVRDLIAEYASDVGVQMNGLHFGRSIMHEAGFAKWLKKRGHAAYFA